MLNFGHMARSEQQFIDLCKQQIEQKFSFGNGRGYTQRDLEVLSTHIQNKTGVIISLSTLKRLWKGDYKQSPQLATLNALAAILDHHDWQGFKLANQKKVSSSAVMLKWSAVIVIISVITGVMIIGFSFESENPKGEKFAEPPAINGPVYFEASKTVTHGIPNTVIFKYDVSNVEADTFYVQQSWNPDHRIGLDPKGRAVSRIYYESGFHRARLIANDSVIAMQPIHILSDGWEPHMYYSDADPQPLDFKHEKFIADGQLHLDSNMLAKRNVDYSKTFFSRITNSRAFNVHSDNFSFYTRMKTDSVLPQLCPWMDVVIVTDVQSFMVSWTKKGCEKNAAYQLGEILKKGDNNDLSALGCDIYEWQELDLHVKNREAVIYLNGQPVYREVYKKNFGKIVALIYIFDGKGSIDYARLENGDGQLVFEDTFKR
jgi:hypothetical protein